jgi:hypothetical protein
LLCSPVKVNRCFRGIYCLNLQMWRVSQATNQHKPGSKYQQVYVYLLPGACWFLAWLTLQCWIWICSSKMSVDSSDYMALYLRRQKSSHLVLNVQFLLSHVHSIHEKVLSSLKMDIKILTDYITLYLFLK